MQAAEDGEEESYDEGQRDAKERGEHLVDEVFTDLIHGRAADPHFIKAVRGVRLCYHILKGQLQVSVQVVRVPIRLTFVGLLSEHRS